MIPCINNSWIVISLGVAGSFAGCKKFIQIDPPSSQIVTASVFNDNNAATAAVTSIYSSMESESWYMSQSTGLLSDELQSPSNSDAIQPYYRNALLATASPGPWASAFSYIYQANAVIEGLGSGHGISSAVRDQLTGEAKFIRAFWNFYLVNCYGDVPLVLTTDYAVNSTLGRTPRDKVYQQMVNDLKDAKELLNSNYVDGTDTATSSERVRPNKSAAGALLARIYLYIGDYEDAEVEAGTILSNGLYQLVHDLNSVFLKNSTEAIWQLGIPMPNNYNTTDGYNFILTAAPSNTTAAQTATIAPRLWNSFEIGDQRMANWIGSITTNNPANTYYFPYKYKNNSLSITEYTMILRLSEQYLIHAEAIVRQNKNLGQAVIDIDSVRQRAGLGNYMGPLLQDSLLSVILHERQVELFTEWGHRWFDLIRTKNVDAVMGQATLEKGGKWKSQWALFPIPQSERLKDINLTQNDGY